MLQVSHDQQVQNTLLSLKNSLGTWDAVGAKLGVNKGLAHQVAMGKRTSPTVYHALGLAVPVAVQPCPCGRVHLRGTCAAGRRTLQRRASADPAFLRFIQETVVPFLDARQPKHTAPDSS